MIALILQMSCVASICIIYAVLMYSIGKCIQGFLLMLNSKLCRLNELTPCKSKGYELKVMIFDLNKNFGSHFKGLKTKVMIVTLVKVFDRCKLKGCAFKGYELSKAMNFELEP